MPDSSDELDLSSLISDQSLKPGIRDALRKLGERDEARAAAEAEAASARRELAFLRAGIPTDTGPGKLLAKAYDGPADADAIRKAAEDYGLKFDSGNAAAKQVADDNALQAELARQRDQAAAASGSAPAGAIPFEDAIRNAKSIEEVMALVDQAPEGAFGAEGRRIKRAGFD